MIQQKCIKLNVLKLTIAIQLTILSFVGLDITNINVFNIFIPSIIQHLITFITILIYLLLIPGLLTVKILRIESCLTTTIILSIGISIALVTFLSTLIGVALVPLFDKPLSKIPLTIFLLIFSTLLLILAWRKAKSYTITINFSLLHILLLYIPILMIIGKAGQNYFLMFAVLIIISLLPLITILCNVNEKFYSLIIWSISSSLVFNHLIFESRFNMRYDDIAPCVGVGIIKAGIWDPTYPVTHNSLLMPIIFPTIFSILSGIDIAIGTRVVLCIINSLIPVILYQIFKQFFNYKISFLASCLYAFYPFKLVGNSKTCFAFFFVSLLILIAVSYCDKTHNKTNKLVSNILLLIFVFSIVTSHYGTVYMFMFVLLISVVLGCFEKKFRNSKFDYHLLIKLAILIFTFAFSWYLYTSKAVNFGWGVGIYHHILTHLQDLFNPEESAAVRAFVTRSVTPSFSLEVTKWLLFMLSIFIIIGAIKIFYLYIKNKIDIIYAIFALSFCSALAGITQMGTVRIFGFSLLLTAPLAIIGFSEVLRVIGHKEERKHLLAFSIYLFILFAFTYGFVANSINFITKDVKDMSLHGNIKEKILESDNIYFKHLIYWDIYFKRQPDSICKAVVWFFIHQRSNEELFVDSLVLGSYLFTLHLPREYSGVIVCNLTQPNVKDIGKILRGEIREGYVFLAYHNLHDNFIYVADMKGNEFYYRTSNYKWIFEKMNKIYDSCGGTFYIAS